MWIASLVYYSTIYYSILSNNGRELYRSIRFDKVVSIIENARGTMKKGHSKEIFRPKIPLESIIDLKLTIL